MPPIWVAIYLPHNISPYSMNLPPKYTANLTPYQRLLQQKLIAKSQKVYEKTGKVRDRPEVSEAKTPRSSHAKKFEDRYGYPITDKAKVKEDFPDTDIQEILAKGAAAYASSGSRPNVSSFQWREARLASVLTGGPALKVDKDLVGPISYKKITSY